ncbi:hypothetical protein EDC33_1066 [Salinicoccus roseus]|nr:hypothetical protein EDC33_1066 [Salinicoccus roseus]
MKQRQYKKKFEMIYQKEIDLKFATVKDYNFSFF